MDEWEYEQVDGDRTDDGTTVEVWSLMREGLYVGSILLEEGDHVYMAQHYAGHSDAVFLEDLDEAKEWVANHG